MTTSHLVHPMMLSISGSKVLLGCLSLLIAATILLDLRLLRRFISLEVFHFLAVHVLHDSICLPLLKAKTDPFVTIIFIIGLIFVVFNLNEVRVDGVRVERKRDNSIDRSSLGDDLECPRLFILELDQVAVVSKDLVSLILAGFEELGEGEPLASHLGRTLARAMILVCGGGSPYICH
jgi:hypothetical protein